jgi:hypothetical protein
MSVTLNHWIHFCVVIYFRDPNSENTPTFELLKLIHPILQTRNLVDRSSPYPRRFGNVSDIEGMNVTSNNAINIAR